MTDNRNKLKTESLTKLTYVHANTNFIDGIEKIAEWECIDWKNWEFEIYDILELKNNRVFFAFQLWSFKKTRFDTSINWPKFQKFLRSIEPCRKQ